GNNLYAFVANTPLALVDRQGLASCKCEIRKPLTIRLTPPKDIWPLGGDSIGPSDKAVWDGKFASIWFTMKATFNGRCCEFRQNRKTHSRYGNGPPEEDKGF